MSSVILVDKGDEIEVIEEERQEWLIRVLLALGVLEEAFDLEDLEMRQYLAGLELEVWHNTHDDSIDIIRKGKAVAQWKQPELVLVRKDRKPYYEIHISEWALPFQMKKGEGK